MLAFLFFVHLLLLSEGLERKCFTRQPNEQMKEEKCAKKQICCATQTGPPDNKTWLSCCLKGNCALVKEMDEKRGVSGTVCKECDEDLCNKDLLSEGTKILTVWWTLLFYSVIGMFL